MKIPDEMVDMCVDRMTRSVAENRHCTVAPHGRDRIHANLRRIATLFADN